MNHLFRKKILALALIALCACQPMLAVAFDLPSIGDTSESYLSTDDEQRLGDAFMRQIRQTLSIVDDPEIEIYIQSLGYRLVSQSSSPGRQFTFFVVDDADINAFAGPGGYIGVNTGLILTAKSEDELASVIAHEIAHVTQRHLARAYEATSKMSLPATAAILAAVILGSNNSQMGEAAFTAAIAGSVQSQINFTRANELEADRIGLSLLAASGFDPRSMPMFFERLHRATNTFDNNQLEFLRTHPVTLNRIADTRNRAEQYPLHPAPDNTGFLLTQAKLRLSQQINLQQDLAYYEKSFQDNGQEHSDPDRYAYALALLKNGQYDPARTQANILVKNKPENIAYQILHAKIELADDNIDKALSIYARNLGLYPRNHPLTMLYAEALLQNNQPAEATVLLEDQLRYAQPTPSLYKKLAQANTAAGNKVAAHQTLAEYYYLIGQTHTAIEQLKIALNELTDKDSNRQARITARIDYLKQQALLETKL